MTQFFYNFFSTIFNGNVILATIIISMIPIIELRGAIPFATNPEFWTVALSNWTAFGYSLLGSCLIVPIIALIFIPLMNLLKKVKFFNKLAVMVENRIKSKTEKISQEDISSKRFSKSYWKKVLFTFIFVAVPLPLTGVWTGTCVAVFIGLDYLTTCITVISGNVIAGLCITLILEFFPALNSILIWIFFGILLLIIAIEVIKHFIKKNKQNKTNETNSQTNIDNSNINTTILDTNINNNTSIDANSSNLDKNNTNLD